MSNTVYVIRTFAIERGGMRMDIREMVRECCIRKLAHILYQCVECPGKRAIIDWTTAENYVDGNQWVIDNVMDRISEGEKEDLVKRGTEVFDRMLGRFIWDCCYQTLKLHLPRPPYGQIQFN